MARPSKYTPELQKKFNELINTLYADDMEDEECCKNFWNFGIIEQLAIYLDVMVSTIYDWSDESSERFHLEFSETLKRWHLITKALVHQITPKISEQSPALAIFLRKTKLGELEISKAILEQKLEANFKLEIKSKIELETMKTIKEARSYGLPEEQIEELETLLEQAKKAKQINGN
jgi:hypothetical protein